MCRYHILKKKTGNVSNRNPCLYFIHKQPCGRKIAERLLRCRQLGSPRNTGTTVTARPVPLKILQCCTHRLGVKCMQSNAYPCWAVNHPFTSDCPSENCRNRGPTRPPAATRLTANISQTIKEAQESSPTLCQAISLVVFHPDAPVFSPSVPTRGAKWPALPTRIDTAHASPALTKTTTPNPATPAAAGSSKINLNCA